MPSPSTESEREHEYPLFGNSEAQINAFVRSLNLSTRILALCGAGLSASAPSSIPTFAGSSALWRGHRASSLSSVEAWEANPGLVWKYFADRRRLAGRAAVNEGHVALAGLARNLLCTRSRLFPSSPPLSLHRPETSYHAAPQASHPAFSPEAVSVPKALNV
jgi:hypothetical protein